MLSQKVISFIASTRSGVYKGGISSQVLYKYSGHLGDFCPFSFYILRFIFSAARDMCYVREGGLAFTALGR